MTKIMQGFHLGHTEKIAGYMQQISSAAEVQSQFVNAT